MVTIGVLALQGAVDLHIRAFEKLNRALCIKKVTVAEDLKGLSGLVIPGGESTTMIHLLKMQKLWNPLQEFSKVKPVWGTCAGAILLAESVENPAQQSLGVLPVEIIRNAYGRQLDSFITTLCVEPSAVARLHAKSIEGVFIRAPQIVRVDKSVEVIIRHHEQPVMIKYENLLATTFHPELTDESVCHLYFATLCEEHLGSTISENNSLHCR